ncbi:sulfonate ABC transporter substrate-binding protein [Erwiniaceae bacterium BAC15a-03b]|uniref:Putative aliphatic sulfonates-binding protein n=1 Tax=Winslowiella arboricola TaxID=2978220 RepID=A0A9J6PQK8_9GAMM|nr:sulfonate ABC transporter substrate-binding protein [Winslowiella arboricola]MCU5772476.1 sulfonate ABC transporter substrate-binding protein [Winslowiella arboricola]MCU5779730.1 sulfonate ABC transporter substrate-binding protein [Winslowiella arboricola]
MVAAAMLGSLHNALAETAPKTVNIGYQKANIFALLKYRGTLDAQFKKQGIAVRWVEFPAGPQMLEGLNIGSIDLAATGDAPPTFAQAAQAELVYLAHSPANPKTEAIVVPENSPIKSVADLKGKRVALNKGSDVNYLLVSALEDAGLSYKDITPVYLPPADARAAFQRGAVDAWVIWDPYYAEVETNAKARLVKNAEGLVPHYTFYLASRKFADTYPQTAKQVVDELGTLSDWANKNPQAAAKILSDSTGLPQPVWQRALARMPYGAERMTPEVFKQQQALADKFSQIGLLPVKVDVSSATWSLDKK